MTLIQMPTKRMLLAVLLMLVGATAISLMAAVSYSSQTSPLQEAVPAIPEKGLFLVGAGIAAGLAALGAGLGLGTASAAAIAAIAEKAELFGRTLVYIVLIEAIAIYGLAMFFIIFSLL